MNGDNGALWCCTDEYSARHGKLDTRKMGKRGLKIKRIGVCFDKVISIIAAAYGATGKFWVDI